MDFSLPGPSLHQISKARLLEWVAISFSRGSSQLKDQTFPALAGRFFTTEPTGKPIYVCVCVCMYKYMHIYIGLAKMFIWVFVSSYGKAQANFWPNLYV